MFYGINWQRLILVLIAKEAQHLLLLKSNPSRPTKPTSSILPRRWRH
jgi:hypothetical protein